MIICKNCNSQLDYSNGYCEICGNPLSGSVSYSNPKQSIVDDILNKSNKYNPFHRESQKPKINYQQNSGTILAPQHAAKLVLHNNSTIPLVNTITQLGRNDFNAPDSVSKYISSNHFNIFNNNGRFYIEDKGSTGGTKLNGVEIRQMGLKPLNNGDIILLANIYKITFRS